MWDRIGKCTHLTSLSVAFPNVELSAFDVSGGMLRCLLKCGATLTSLTLANHNKLEYPRGDQSWRLEVEAFIEDIRLGRAPSPGLSDAAEVLRVVETIYRRSGCQ